ncbi:MAG: RpiB/LacA/LacB family sugar-phosphate isomerase, partial [Candidatus Rokubacteria bacterium]|nr:RpiB/LacA/LacB family sugar-phosphate isomerase [Candidatus Rokubacteria bacterium]
MRIAIGCDHVGYALKSALIEALEGDEHAVLDLGTHAPDPTDYPPVARAVATAIAKDFVDLGVVACASGAGASIAANRFAGIRAAACEHPDAARQSRERLDVNLVCVDATLDPARLLAIVREWLGAGFRGAEPDVRALAKLAELEGAPRLA